MDFQSISLVVSALLGTGGLYAFLKARAESRLITAQAHELETKTGMLVQRSELDALKEMLSTYETELKRLTEELKRVRDDYQKLHDKYIETREHYELTIFDLKRNHADEIMRIKAEYELSLRKIEQQYQSERAATSKILEDMRSEYEQQIDELRRMIGASTRSNN